MKWDVRWLDGTRKRNGTILLNKTLYFVAPTKKDYLTRSKIMCQIEIPKEKKFFLKICVYCDHCNLKLNYILRHIPCTLLMHIYLYYVLAITYQDRFSRFVFLKLMIKFYNKGF